MKLAPYINRLGLVANDYEGWVYKLLLSRENYVLIIPKMRFHNLGTDADDKLITPSYTPKYIKRKQRKSKRSSHVTLHWSGELWNSFKLSKTINGIDFKAKDDDITDFLKGHYPGNKLFGFSPKDEEQIYALFIKPELEELINGVDIDLEI